MKIAVVNTMAPYVYGGAEFLADSLCEKLIEYGHEAQLIRLPFSHYPMEHIVDSMMVAFNTKLPNTDLMIGLKFPSYFVPHENKRLWLLHQFRQAYDFAGTEYDCFSDSEKDQKIKQTIKNADNRHLKALEGKIFTNSHVVSNRLKKYNDIHSEVLYPPLMDAHLFSFGEIGDYIFYPSRISRSKRQFLAVEAMQYVKTGVKLIIAGKGDTAEDENFLKDMITKCGVGDKVTYMDRFISQEEKAELFRNCLGGIYIPVDEDSYGYVTLECIHSEKPVISCSDSGGTDIVVKDGITGYMTEPNARKIARAMDQLYANKKKARTMGNNALKLLNELNISWDLVIERLTA